VRKYISRIPRKSLPLNVTQLNPEEVKNILIVRQHNQLGDMLCSVPLFAALRKSFPLSHITLIASPTNYEIFYCDINPYLDEVITYRKSSLKDLKDFYRFLKNRKYQIGIVPSTVSISRTSHYINYISGAKIRVGVRSIDNKHNKVGHLLNVKKDFFWDTKKLHQVERNLDIGRQIGCDLEEGEKKNVQIHLSNEEEKFAGELICSGIGNKNMKPQLIGIHPGAGKKANIWKPEYFLQLMKKLNEKPVNAPVRRECFFFITASTIDKEITSQIISGLKNSGVNYLLIENIPIRKVAAVLKRLDLYITNDTGTMHVAGSVDANLLALFGPTHGYEWAPLGNNKHYIQSPTGNINDITVDEVYKKTLEILPL
jgi:ADP-heptose:LPS heptosyltransferase